MSAPYNNCSLDVRGYPIDAVLALLAPYHPKTVAWHQRQHEGVDQLCLIEHVESGAFFLPAPMDTTAMGPMIEAWLADPARIYPESSYTDAWERKACRAWTDMWGHGYYGSSSFVTIQPFTGLIGK